MTVISPPVGSAAFWQKASVAFLMASFIGSSHDTTLAAQEPAANSSSDSWWVFEQLVDRAGNVLIRPADMLRIANLHPQSDPNPQPQRGDRGPQGQNHGNGPQPQNHGNGPHGQNHGNGPQPQWNHHAFPGGPQFPAQPPAPYNGPGPQPQQGFSPPGGIPPGGMQVFVPNPANPWSPPPTRPQSGVPAGNPPQSSAVIELELAKIRAQGMAEVAEMKMNFLREQFAREVDQLRQGLKQREVELQELRGRHEEAVAVSTKLQMALERVEGENNRIEESRGALKMELQEAREQNARLERELDEIRQHHREHPPQERPEPVRVDGPPRRPAQEQPRGEMPPEIVRRLAQLEKMEAELQAQRQELGRAKQNMEREMELSKQKFMQELKLRQQQEQPEKYSPEKESRVKARDKAPGIVPEKVLEQKRRESDDRKSDD